MYDMMVIWSRTKGANYIKHTYTAFSHLILNFVKNESWNEERTSYDQCALYFSLSRVTVKLYTCLFQLRELFS